MWAKEWEVPPRYEAQIHNAVFNILSRPFSSTPSSSFPNKSRSSPIMGTNPQDHSRHISWNHFGKKYNFQLNGNEVQHGNRGNFYQVLMGKILDECPEFKGTLAYTNSQGNEVIIDSDSALRQAFAETHNYLKLYTTLNISSDSAGVQSFPSSIVAASDMLNKSFQYSSRRSNSVPPRSIYSDFSSSNSRSPGGSEGHDHEAYRVTSSRQRFYSPRSPSTAPCNSYSRGIYSQPMLYGMPPRNLVLSQLLLAGAGFHPAMVYPVFFPRSERYVGPNKFHNMSSGTHYCKSGWCRGW